MQSLESQRDRLVAHAGNALSVASLVFAAGIFTGILSGTKMVDAMSASVIASIPAHWGPYMAPITAVISAPFTFFISNDAFYFGMLPILADTGAHYGLTAAQIEEMYQVMAIANYEDRFVIPTGHREDAEDMYDERGGCGFTFGNGCSGGSSDTNLFGAPARKRLQTPSEVF